MRAMWRVSFRPMNFQFLPASTDLYAPSLQEEIWRLFASPVPTQTIFVLEGATVTSPTDIIAFTPSNTGAHDVPPLVLLNTPPLAVAM